MLKNFLGRTKKTLQEQYPQYKIGRGSYANDLEVLRKHDGADLQIGAFCSIAAGVKIFLGGEHRTDWVTTYPFNALWEKAANIKGHPKTKGDIKIGNDVWIGRDAVILSGVKIGDGAVIGVRAVVTKDIPPYAIAVSNPARVIKKRFDDILIDRLLRIKWWNWDDARIENALTLMLNDDIVTFLDAVKNNEI